VLRAVLIAAVLCISFETSGMASVFGDESCSEECPTDASGGECAPNCPFCACCSLPKTMSLPFATAGAVIAAIADVTWGRTTVRPPCADPAAIFHVPKPILA
jgi:hypothetical protein